MPRPSVNINTVTPFEPSGDVPDNVVPPVPTLAESVFGSFTTPCPVFAEFSALVAAAGSGRTRMVSTISDVLDRDAALIFEGGVGC